MWRIHFNTSCINLFLFPGERGQRSGPEPGTGGHLSDPCSLQTQRLHWVAVTLTQSKSPTLELSLFSTCSCKILTTETCQIVVSVSFCVGCTPCKSTVFALITNPCLHSSCVCMWWVFKSLLMVKEWRWMVLSSFYSPNIALDIMATWNIQISKTEICRWEA